MVVSGRKRVSIPNQNKSSHLIICEFSSSNSKDEDDSFHKAIKRVAIFVQFLFLMPVCNISCADSKLLRFKWNSFRVIATIVYILYGIFTTILFFKFIYELGINTKNIGEL